MDRKNQALFGPLRGYPFEMQEVKAHEIKDRVEQNREAIVQFMLDIVAIPSMEQIQLKEVAAAAEFYALFPIMLKRKLK